MIKICWNLALVSHSRSDGGRRRRKHRSFSAAHTAPFPFLKLASSILHGRVVQVFIPGLNASARTHVAQLASDPHALPCPRRAPTRLWSTRSAARMARSYAHNAASVQQTDRYPTTLANDSHTHATHTHLRGLWLANKIISFPDTKSFDNFWK